MADEFSHSKARMQLSSPDDWVEFTVCVAMALRKRGLWDDVKQQPDAAPTAEAIAAGKANAKAGGMAVGIMSDFCDSHHMGLIARCTDGLEAWNELKKIYAPKNAVQDYKQQIEWTGLALREDEPLASFSLRIKNARRNMKEVGGHGFTEEQVITKFLAGLPLKYQQQTIAVLSSIKQYPSLDDVVAHLTTTERVMEMQSQQALPTAPALAAPRWAPRRQQEQPQQYHGYGEGQHRHGYGEGQHRHGHGEGQPQHGYGEGQYQEQVGDDQCRYCGRMGHWERDCEKKKKDRRQQAGGGGSGKGWYSGGNGGGATAGNGGGDRRAKQLAMVATSISGSSGLALCASASANSEQYYKLDTAAGIHLTYDKDDLHFFQMYDKPVPVVVWADGRTAVSLGQGLVQLRTIDGGTFGFSGVELVPSLKHRILSYGMVEKLKGVKVRLDGASGSISYGTKELNTHLADGLMYVSAEVVLAASPERQKKLAAAELSMRVAQLEQQQQQQQFACAAAKALAAARLR